MKCPKCGREMEYGYLHAEPPVVWSTKEVKHTMFTAEKEGDVKIRGRFSDLFGPRCDETTLCRNCRMIILRY